MAKPPPLVVEHVSDTINLCFLALIEYKKVRYLTVVENVIDEDIHAYVLDQLEAEGIDQQWFMSVATRWFYGASDKYPLSFEFTKHGQGDVIKKALKTFNMNSASRVIGKLFVFNVNGKPKVRRRKVQPLPEVLEVKFKSTGKVETLAVHRQALEAKPLTDFQQKVIDEMRADLLEIDQAIQHITDEYDL